MASLPRRKSSLGKQASARFRSAPDYGFGTMERAQADKVFISKEMEGDKFGQGSPGPVYAPKAVDGHYHTPSAYSFGASHRYAFASMKRSGATIPGPGQYTLNGSVAKQADSQKHSYSSWKFGTSTRADQAKVFVSPAHAKSVTEFIDSPGPSAYGHKGSIGTQANSTKNSSGSYVRAPRRILFHFISPLPTPESFIFSDVFASRCMHTQGMGTAERFHADKAADSDKSFPGPGTYTLRSAMGRQVTGDRPSYAVNSFPRADRDKTATTVYIGKAQSLAFWGRGSPRPAVYTPTASVGYQPSSSKPNVPKFGFGTADRFAYINIGQRAMQSPGPGAYSV